MLPAINPILADITWPIILLAIAFVAISLFMMLVILIQKPKGGGLSGAFGGAGGGESSFVGAKVGDFLTYLTVGCFIAFLVLAMLLTWNINPTENQAKAAAIAEQTSESTAGTTDDAETIEDETQTDAQTTLDGGEVMIEEVQTDTEAAAAEIETQADEAAPTPAAPSE